MKTTTYMFQAFILSILILVVPGCEKGEDGEPGKDGSANVTARNFPVSQWTSSSSFWYLHLSVPELTTSNINSASVQVYWGTADNNWLALPYTYVGTTSGNYFMNFLTTVNLVEVRWQYNLAGIGDSPTSVLGDVKFKVVVIPPSVLKTYPDLDLNNYREVKETLHLKE